MHPSLSEVLYWAACWIAAVAALLGLAALLADSRASWIGAGTFTAVAVAIWLLGRVSLWLAVLKQARARRRR
jgi:spore maturation protein SpmA